jgi:CRP/FNR family cyclic AMP-dependent transcriptional regulator
MRLPLSAARGRDRTAARLGQDMFPPKLRRLTALQTLSDAELVDVSRLFRPRLVDKGSVLSLDEQLAHRMCFVHSGRFRLAVLSPAGTSVSLRTIEPGDHFGELWSFAETPYSNHHVVADVGGVLLELPTHNVSDLCARMPAFAGSITRALARTTVAQSARIYEFACLGARGRLQAELLRLADARRSGVTAVIDPAPTHAAIASQIGTTREGVTRHLRDLTSRGLIRSQRGRIVVLNVNQLRSEIEREAGGSAVAL